MAPKRKLKQISIYYEKSNGSSKSNLNERKSKKKRMKKTETTEDPKVVFELNRKNSISVAKSRAKKVINACLSIARLTTLKKK